MLREVRPLEGMFCSSSSDLPVYLTGDPPNVCVAVSVVPRLAGWHPFCFPARALQHAPGPYHRTHKDDGRLGHCVRASDARSTACSREQRFSVMFQWLLVCEVPRAVDLHLQLPAAEQQPGTSLAGTLPHAMLASADATLCQHHSKSVHFLYASTISTFAMAEAEAGGRTFELAVPKELLTIFPTHKGILFEVRCGLAAVFVENKDGVLSQCHVFLPFRLHIQPRITPIEAVSPAAAALGASGCRRFSRVFDLELEGAKFCRMVVCGLGSPELIAGSGEPTIVVQQDAGRFHADDSRQSRRAPKGSIVPVGGSCVDCHFFFDRGSAVVIRRISLVLRRREMLHSLSDDGVLTRSVLRTEFADTLSASVLVPFCEDSTFQGQILGVSAQFSYCLIATFVGSVGGTDRELPAFEIPLLVQAAALGVQASGNHRFHSRLSLSGSGLQPRLSEEEGLPTELAVGIPWSSPLFDGHSP